MIIGFEVNDKRLQVTFDDGEWSGPDAFKVATIFESKPAPSHHPDDAAYYIKELEKDFEVKVTNIRRFENDREDGIIY